MADDKAVTAVMAVESMVPKRLPWGLKPESLAPGSMKTIPEQKLKAFQMGRNPLKSKALPKQKEEEKKKAEEAAAAEVYAEYLASFQSAAATGKTFIKGATINPDKDGNDDGPAKLSYKPKSKMAELAEEFKKKDDKQEILKVDALGLKKKKEKEKKKSNLELFKEELEKQQKEREIRHKIKKGDLSGIPDDVLATLPASFFKPGKFEDEFAYNYGSHDTGDPNTTNLYIGNINPKMNEEQLCKVFGQFGPLASVKIMWPRTDEEKARNRNCGFVAFMNRKDGENALNDLSGKDIMKYEMKLGWGKAVPVPPQPIYVPPELIEAQQPPPPSGLPFNAQISRKFKRDRKEFDGNLENTVVKVVIPTERNCLSLINRVVEFVAREGPMFEAMIMNKEINNPMFRFLFDNKCPEHVYYRWRLFSILMGDTPQKWSQSEFRMFTEGSIWRPPPMNPYSMSALQISSQGLASASSAIVHSGAPIIKQPEVEEVIAQVDTVVKKERLNDGERDKLEDLLRMVTTDRSKIAELMIWSLDHADCADEITECITESLSLLETPIQTKVARLYLVSDILHNSSAKVRHASYFRKGFETQLKEIMQHLRNAYTSCSSKMQSEKFRKQVLSCLAAWQDWAVYPPIFLINLQNVFVGIADTKSVLEDALDNMKEIKDDVDGFPLVKEDQDVDGIPFAAPDADIDGFPLSKGGGSPGDIDGIPLDGVPLDDSDIDGIPFDKTDSASIMATGKMKSSRWDPVDLDAKPAKSRWERDEEEQEEEPAVPKSKWETDEASKSKQNDTKTKSGTPKDSKWQNTAESSDDRTTDEEAVKDAPASPAIQHAEVDESRRKFLREVELKVVKFSDKLEASGGPKSGRTLQEESERYRLQLLEEYERGKRKKAKERKRVRSRSGTPVRKSEVTRKKKSRRSRSRSKSRSRSRSKSRSRSVSKSPVSQGSYSDERESVRSTTRKRSSKTRRSRSKSRSPNTPRRNTSSTKKKKKKSRR